jgi:hypothetical protein
VSHGRIFAAAVRQGLFVDIADPDGVSVGALPSPLRGTGGPAISPCHTSTVWCARWGETGPPVAEDHAVLGERQAVRVDRIRNQGESLRGCATSCMRQAGPRARLETGARLPTPCFCTAARYQKVDTQTTGRLHTVRPLAASPWGPAPAWVSVSRFPAPAAL